MIRKKNFFITSCFLIPLFFSDVLFAQSVTQPLRTVDLTKQEPSWQAVVGGKAVAVPCETSYGFAVSGDGRMLSSCSGTGKVLWQKGVRGKPTPYVSSGAGDFLYTVTNDSDLNLVNPSGLTLWTVTSQFVIINSPLTGRDGRIFIRGSHTIACYGINGVRKWTVETEALSPLQLCELNDGSILVFLAFPENNKTVARRYSPFGAELEKITFSGLVKTASSCSEGVILALDNGSCGLCSVEKNTADSRWVLAGCTVPSPLPTLISISNSSNEAAFFSQFGSSMQISIVDIKTGKLTHRFTAAGGNLSSFCTSRSTDAGWFFSDSSHAFEFTSDGTVMWEASLPSSSDWNYVFYTNTNYLVLCMNSWVLNAFLMTQTVCSSNPAAKHDLLKTYDDFYTSSGFTDSPGYDQFISALLSSQDISDASTYLKNGDYGTKEQKWTALIKTEIMRYTAEQNSSQSYSHYTQTYFDSQPSYTASLISLCSLSGTTTFIPFISSLIETESDPSLRTELISAVQNAPFDPDGRLLSSLSNLLLYKLSPSDKTQLKCMCDAVYEVCRFMGRPAFYAKGKEMLAYLLYPQFDKETRDYTRQTLQRIIKLEL